MTGRMKLSFNSPVKEEPPKILIIETLEDRKKAFKENEEFMKETTKFVTEIIETAQTEATRRKLEKENAGAGEGHDAPAESNADTGSRLRGNDNLEQQPDGWNNRARGFCNRLLNAIFPCFTNNGNKS